jgi:roadblock/LC7 domain-containing protein
VIKQMLAVDGVMAVCRFRDDGAFVEGYGVLPQEDLVALAHFAHDYKRIVQGNADQLSMFTGIKGWTPPGGWVVRGAGMSVCSVANLVCTVENAEGNLSEVMDNLTEASHY